MSKIKRRVITRTKLFNYVFISFRAPYSDLTPITTIKSNGETS